MKAIATSDSMQSADADPASKGIHSSGLRMPDRLSGQEQVWRDNQDESGTTIKMRRSGRMEDDCRWPRALQAD
jgi:hypothetical protein